MSDSRQLSGGGPSSMEVMTTQAPPETEVQIRAGPVFIHATQCAGPDGTGFPAELTGAHRVLRAYSAGGQILGGRLASAAELADSESAGTVLAEVLADPAVAVVHVRAVEHGCFAFEARRA